MAHVGPSRKHQQPEDVKYNALLQRLEVAHAARVARHRLAEAELQTEEEKLRLEAAELSLPRDERGSADEREREFARMEQRLQLAHARRDIQRKLAEAELRVQEEKIRLASVAADEQFLRLKEEEEEAQENSDSDCESVSSEDAERKEDKRGRVQPVQREARPARPADTISVESIVALENCLHEHPSAGSRLLRAISRELERVKHNHPLMHPPPAAQCVQTDTHVFVTLDVPGCRQADTRVRYRPLSRELIVTGERDAPEWHGVALPLHDPRSWGKFCQIVRIPCAVDQPESRLRDGVLIVALRILPEEESA